MTKLYKWNSMRGEVKRLLQGTLMSFFLLGMVHLSSAQTTIKGVVTDSETQEPLIGANIIVKGTSQGTVTNVDGSYTLVVPAGAETLIITYIGYVDQEVSIGNRTTIDISMSSDLEALEEIVVVGYGTTKKPEFTGSVATIKKKAIDNVIAADPTTSLQGRLSGVQVEAQAASNPGAPANVFIRGVNSLSNANPLYVVDGLFVDNITWVNPNDIASISVLKDAAASSIYGSRAANGVILVTTNHGETSEKPVVTVTSRVGFDTPSKRLDFLDGQQYTDYLNQRFENDGVSNRVTWNGVNTDWQDENLSSGAISDIGVSVAGGGKNTTYFFSVNRFDQDGILVGSGFDRTNFRANTQSNLGRFKITQSLGVTEGRRQRNNWFGFDGVTAPTVALRNPNNEGGFEAPSLDIHGPGGVNQFALASLEENEEITRTVFGSVKVDFEVTDWLTASTNLGLDFVNLSFTQFTPTFFASNVDAVRNLNQQNDLTVFSQNDLNTLIENTLNFKRDFGKNSFDLLVGHTFFRETQNSSGIFGQGTPSNQIRSVSSLTPGDDLTLLGENNEAALQSFFGRLNYNYAGKILFSATVRRDEVSRFAPENRADIFPSFSAGWNISDEAFWSSSTLSGLKVRASYGELGSFPETFFPTEAVFLANQSNTSFGGVGATGLAQVALADPDLIWETTKTFDIGVDAEFLDSRLLVTADFYTKDIEDVLVDINVPSTSGVILPVIRNAGTIENQGLELEALYRKAEGDFTYNISGNISFNLRNQAGDLPSTILGPAVDEDLRIVNRTTSNQPVGSFFGFIVEDRVDPETGDFVRRDINGDGQITADDQTVIGNPNPDFTYGINFDAKYKNWDFRLNFNGVSGNEIYNLGRFYSILWQDGGKLTDVLDAWTPSNRDTSIPRATVNDPANNRAPSSFFVENGSYLRLKNVDVGYTFGDVSDWISRLRVSFSIQNALLFTGYSGYDPDVASTNSGRANLNSGVPGRRTDVNPLLGRGLDQRAFPNARTFTLGVQATF